MTMITGRKVGLVVIVILISVVCLGWRLFGVRELVISDAQKTRVRVHYRWGRTVQVDRDMDRDGFYETHAEYSFAEPWRDRELPYYEKRTVVDANEDGKLDTWLTVEIDHGRLVHWWCSVDTNGDGKPDVTVDRLPLSDAEFSQKLKAMRGFSLPEMGGSGVTHQRGVNR
jgi:hypothetical protein